MVTVLGAGISISARYPATAGLTALLWDALDTDPVGRGALASRLARGDSPAKSLVGTNESVWSQAWEAVKQSRLARARLQETFCRLDAERSSRPSPAHDALAVLLHARVIEYVISLNWDTALEQAYARRYGVQLPKAWVMKPHGDAADPGEDWVFPHESGLVTEAVRATIGELVSDHPRLLLVVGYSESDETVVTELIAPLDSTWPVVRIGPSANRQGDVAAAAEVALPELAASYQAREDAAPWHAVTFNGQRNISTALAGERLGPRDTVACPRLSEVQYVLDALRDRHAAVINGESGTGKSISAYQALHELSRQGFEVLRLRDSARDRQVPDLVAGLGPFPNLRVLFVDDAQDLAPDVTRELADLASEGQRVLIVGIDHVASGITNIKINSQVAIGTLAHEMRQRESEILPLVAKLDDRVGTRLGDQPVGDRIDEASQADSAWQFFFILSGGWRRMEKRLLELRQAHRADFALLALAVAQIASTDAAVARATLVEAAQSIGRDDRWIDGCLQVLVDKRLVLEDEGLYRCAHLRVAWSVLRWMLHPPRYDFPPAVPRPVVPPIASAPSPAPPKLAVTMTKVSTQVILPPAASADDRAAAVAVMNWALDSPVTSLRGLAWLVGRNHDTQTRWVMTRYGVLTETRVPALAARALITPSGPEAGLAAQVLSELMLSSEDLVLAVVRGEPDRLLDWVAALTPENVWGIGDLFNALSNRDMEFAGALLEHANAQVIADLIPAGGWPNAYATAHAVGRLIQAGGVPLATKVDDLYNDVAFRALFSSLPADLPRIDTVFHTLAYSSRQLGLALFDSVALELGEKVSADPVPLTQQLFDSVFWLLGYAPKFLRGKYKPSTAQRRLARKFIRAIDPVKLVEAIESPGEGSGWFNFNELFNFIAEADPLTMRKMIGAVDLVKFEESTKEGLITGARSVMYFYHLIAAYRWQEVQAIFDRHEGDFTALDIVLAMISPRSAANLLMKGLPLDLGIDGHHWELAAETVEAIATVDEQVAAEIIQANRGVFVSGLSNNYSDRFEGMTHWVQTCDDLVPGFVDNVLTSLPVGSVASWAKELRKPARRHEIAPLALRAAASGEVMVAAEARELCRKFPSIDNG